MGNDALREALVVAPPHGLGGPLAEAAAAGSRQSVCVCVVWDQFQPGCSARMQGAPLATAAAQVLTVLRRPHQQLWQHLGRCWCRHALAQQLGILHQQQQRLARGAGQQRPAGAGAVCRQVGG